MGYETWHNYGYGICVSEIGEVPVERLETLLQCAPVFHSQVQEWMRQHAIDKPTYENYMEYDQTYMLGLASLLSDVIKEAEHVEFTACDSYDGDEFLIYTSSYPWELPEEEHELTEELIQEILAHYVSILTDEELTIEYRSVENGS